MLGTFDGLPFLFSTYFTSALWAAFLVGALIVRTCAKSRLLAVVLETISESQHPARTTAGVFIVPLLLVAAAFQVMF